MIEVRPTGDGDLPGLLALFESRFGHPLSAAEWQWKYRQLPGVGRSLVAVDAAGSVVAHAGALRLPARWGDVATPAEGGIWQLVDFAGAARRGGLRPALVELGRRLLADLPAPGDAPWIFGFPSERHFKLGERVFGYRPLTTLAPLAGELAVPLAAAASAPATAAGGGEIESGDSCGDWAAAVWERCGVLGVRRSAAFLNWRYWARPERYYRFYRLRWRGIEGLAVFAFVGEEAWAAELWLPPEGEWYAALRAVAADLHASGLRVWRFWPPSSPRDPRAARPDSLLHRLGLRPDGSVRFVGCRGGAGTVAGGMPDPVAAAGGFYYAMGDYDLV